MYKRILLVITFLISCMVPGIYAQQIQKTVPDISTLKREVDPFIHMSLEEVKALVPTASGIYFIGCPNCNGGAQEMNVLSWKPEFGNKLKCNYCKMVFPNEQYPENHEKVIIAPSGAPTKNNTIIAYVSANFLWNSIQYCAASLSNTFICES